MSSNDENSDGSGGQAPPDPGSDWFNNDLPPPGDEDGSSDSDDGHESNDPGAQWFENDSPPPLGEDGNSVALYWHNPFDPGSQWFEDEGPKFASDAHQHDPGPAWFHTGDGSFGSQQSPLDVDYEDDDSDAPATDNDTTNLDPWPFGSEVLPTPEPPLPPPPQIAILSLLGIDPSESGEESSEDESTSSSWNFGDEDEASPPPALAESALEEPDATKIFRSETLITDTDLRVDVADSLRRNVLGDETIETDLHSTHVRGNFSQIAGERKRTAGSYERSTDNEEMYLIDGSYTETVGGRMTIKAALSAEAMVGGTYTNTITGAYLRLAGWVDLMVWGGWLEADLIRTEIAGLMIRSHVAFTHAALVRMSVASRYIDDLTYRIEQFGLVFPCENTYLSSGVPGGGIDVES